MKAMILGADGYLGWALSLRLLSRGHEVIGVDNFATRKSVKEVGSDSGIPILSMENRVRAVRDVHGYRMKFHRGDITSYPFIHKAIKEDMPDTVIHFAEQRSAPYSMINAKHAAYTLSNNVIGTINLVYSIMAVNPKIHILKMGTLGEYGTPNFDIPETPFVDARINGKLDRITCPKWAGSWYHWSKVHDTNNLLFTNRVWKTTVTDIMQGPVYGTRTKEITDEKLHTRFDFDEVWGTVVNRFCVEAALDLPLTAYGKGGQTRGYLSLEDSVEALRLLLENPPEKGDYRVVNQFVELLSINEIAEIVKKAAKRLGIDAKVEHLENPRVEAERHYYNPEIKVLPKLGFHRKLKMGDLAGQLIKDILPYRSRIRRYKGAIMPHTNWRKVDNAR
ncbi:NAD-dependent epimerase/dehydratase family protein [Candidatus Marsarchaeota archaeon]|nr:NAD-dependent epimerase/dehydratase family protein [Candidatus Marsarchaeota archaeon]